MALATSWKADHLPCILLNIAYCRGPTLLGHASTSVLQSKRSYEQIMNDIMPTSFQQQMRNFNSFSFDVSVSLTNTLHGMPSPLHLSSTENELMNANVCYAEFNNGLSVPDCADVPINNDNDDPTVPIIEKCPFQKKRHMSSTRCSVSNSSFVQNERSQRQ